MPPGNPTGRDGLYISPDYKDAYKRPRTAFDDQGGYHYQQTAAGAPYQVAQGVYAPGAMTNDGMLPFPGGTRYYYQ